MDRIEAPDMPLMLDLAPQTYMFILFGFIGLVMLISFANYFRNRANLRRDWREAELARPKPAQPRGVTPAFHMPNDATFKAKSILTIPSLEILGIIEDVVWDINGSFSVLLGCPLEGFLEPEATVGAPQINHALGSEILDYLVINGAGLPVLGVNFYSDGPTGNTRSAGDNSSNRLRTVLNQAGIRFFEVEPGFKTRDVAKRLRRTLNSAIL